MVTSSYADFFLGCAGASAALIGLLFVAVSVAASRAKDKVAETGMQMRASAALLSFSNVMVVSLFCLTPDTNVGWPTTVVGSIGLLFGIASATVLLRSWRHRGQGSLALVLGFLVLFGCEIYFGVAALAHPHRAGPLSGVSWVLVASLTVGVARAWELVGLPDTGAISSMRLIVQGFSAAAEPGKHEQQTPGD